MAQNQLRALGAIATVCAAVFAFASPAAALPNANCRTTVDYSTWLQGLKTEAASKGVTARGIAALDGITPDPKVISADRGQGVFKQSFEQFSGRMISAGRMSGALSRLKSQAPLFAKIEAEFGVPGPVLAAIWAMETDFGATSGNLPVIRSLATLAHDCRRSEYFRGQLIDALKLVDQGVMTTATKGAWAGEIGQMQFTPSVYYKYAVNYGGGRDLVRSSADALASTANYLKQHGWKAGAGWEPGQPNFAAIIEWNKAEVYAKTIAAFATRLQAKLGN